VTESMTPQEPRSGVRPLLVRERAPDPWHSLRALSMGNHWRLGYRTDRQQSRQGAHIFFAILFLIAVAGTVIARLWSRYDYLSWWDKP
jgi:hypothetical protein